MSWQPPSPPEPFEPTVAASTPVVSGELELRPSTSAYVGDMRKRAVIVVPLVLLLIARNVSSNNNIGGWAIAALVVGTAGVSIALVIVHFRTTVVRLTPGRIGISGALVRNRTLDVAGMRGLLAGLAQPMTPPTRTLAVVDQRGRRITLSGSVWSEDDLSAIARHTAAVEEQQVLGVAEFERRVPGALPFWTRRPWLLAGIVVAIVLVAVVVAVLLSDVTLSVPGHRGDVTIRRGGVSPVAGRGRPLRRCCRRDRARTRRSSWGGTPPTPAARGGPRHRRRQRRRRRRGRPPGPRP